MNVCAAWSGAHLSSQFGAQYGVLETEAKFNLPAATGAYAFFGTYMFSCQNSTSNAVCDGMWNEVDQLVYNSSSTGASFGTSLFISKSSTQWDQSVGYGQYSSAGLFSNHDSTGQCGAAACTPAQQASLACPAAPLAFPTPSSAALAAGVPPSVAGGQGCPAYTQSTAVSYANYKLVWTPRWIAWMVNSVVMRNETLDVRPGFVPWRPVTLRPLLRTNSGSSPVLTGTCAVGTPCAGLTVSVPAGLIQNMGTGATIANHVLLSGSTARVNLTASYSLADWSNGACSPCNLFTTSPAIVEQNVLLTNAFITYLPDASVSIRRMKYTPLNDTAIAAAITQPNSWSNPTLQAITVPSCSPPPPVPPTPPSPPLPPAPPGGYSPPPPGPPPSPPPPNPPPSVAIPAAVNPLAVCPTVAHRLENASFADAIVSSAWAGTTLNTLPVQNSLYFDGASSSVGFQNAVLASSQATFSVRAAAVSDQYQRSLLTLKAAGVGTISVQVVNGQYTLALY